MRFGTDLKLLLTYFFTIMLTWFWVLDWNWSHAFSAYDGSAAVMPMLLDLIQHRGDWKEWIYRYELVGGAPTHGVFGSLPVMRLLGWLGVHPVLIYNFLIILFQTLHGFFSQRAMEALLEQWGGLKMKRQWPWILQLGFVWIFAFTSWLGWRVGYGHLFFLYGSLLFTASLSFLLTEQNKNQSYTFIIATIFSWIHAFAVGQQMLVYSFIFGGPILFAAIWRRKVSKLFLVLIGLSLLISSPHWISLYRHHMSSDAARTLFGEEVTYSYITAQFLDWLTSIPWSKFWIPEGRMVLYHHEINYGFGAFLLFLYFVPPQKNRLWILGLCVSMVFALVLSMNFQPLSTWVLNGIPILKSLRVPERAILPFVISLPVFGLAAVFLKLQHYLVPTELSVQRSLFLGVSSSFLYFAPAELREIIVWGLAFLFFIKIYLEKKISSQSLLPLFFLSLGLPSLTGFKERLLPPAVSFQTMDQLDTMRKQLLEAYPGLYLPFIRSEVDLAWAGGGVNTAYWMGLSSLDGYWPPTRRFLELLEALEGKKLPKTTMYFKMSQYPTAYPYLSRLYNLKYQIHLTGNQLQVRPLDTHGESAWFGAEMIRASSYEEIAQWIKANEKDLNRKIALMSSDAFDTKKNIEECVHSKVVSIQGTYRTQRAVVETQSSADCPLVVAANFSEVLIVESESKKNLKTFPAFGVLLGIWVPAGTKKIFIDAN